LRLLALRCRNFLDHATQREINKILGKVPISNQAFLSNQKTSDMNISLLSIRLQFIDNRLFILDQNYRDVPLSCFFA